MNRLILLAIPCEGANEAACVADFIKSAGITDTSWGFDVINPEKEAEICLKIHAATDTTIVPTDYEDNE